MQEDLLRSLLLTFLIELVVYEFHEIFGVIVLVAQVDKREAREECLRSFQKFYFFVGQVAGYIAARVYVIAQMCQIVVDDA